MYSYQVTGQLGFFLFKKWINKHLLIISINENKFLSVSFYKKIYFIDYAITVVPFLSPLFSPPPCTALLPSFPHLTSCPWVIHISYLASPFPIRVLTFPCLFCTYHLCFLFPVPFPPFPLPTDNPPCDRYFCESVPLLVVCSLCFCVCFRFSCWYLWASCHFIVCIFDLLLFLSPFKS